MHSKTVKFIITVIIALCGVFPYTVYAQTDREMFENEPSSVTITMNETTIQVQFAEGQILQVYSLTGMRVATYRIDSDSKSFSHSLSKGCYILKVGKVVRKVSIR